jgi:hypothetical protein
MLLDAGTLSDPHLGEVCSYHGIWPDAASFFDYHVTDYDRLWGNVARRIYFGSGHERDSAGER